MKHTKVIKINKDIYIPHTFGKFELKKGDIVRIKVIDTEDKKSDFNYVDPTFIFLTLISLIIIIAGIFAFFTIWDMVSKDPSMQKEVDSETKTQTVTDPYVDQVMTLPSGATILSVTETLSNGVTQTIPPANYVYAGTTLTVTVSHG